MSISELRQKMPYEPKPIPKGFYIEKDKEHEKIRLIRLKKDPRRVVKKKMTHPRAHNDEAQASMDLSRYGENLYPGISNARVIYADDPRNVDPYKEFRDNGTLCFGIGKYFLDDHNYSGMGVCTTDLVNLHLGVKYPITLKYSDFTRHCDRTKMVLPMEWPTLLKGQYRTEPQNDVFRRAERLHIDFHWFEGGKRPANAKPFRLREYANMLEAEFAGHPGKKGLQRLTNYLREAEDVLDYDIRLSPQENQGRTRPYELARILRIMHALTTWEDYKKTVNLGMSYLRALALKDIAYREKLEDYKRKNKDKMHTRIQIPGTEETINLKLLDRNDDPDMVKIVRSCGADIIVQRNSKGQVQIFTRSRYENGVPYAYITLAKIVAELRKREIVEEGRPMPDHPPEYWEQSGDVPESDKWHYVKEGEYVLNGSDQAGRGVEATRLNLREVILPIVDKFIALAPPETLITSGSRDPEEQDDELDVPDEEEDDTISVNTGSEDDEEESEDEVVDGEGNEEGPEIDSQTVVEATRETKEEDGTTKKTTVRVDKKTETVH